MKKRKLIIICLILSIIALTINLGLFNVLMSKETLAKAENIQNKPVMQWNWTYGGTDGDGARALVQTVDGGFALAGLTWSFGPGYIGDMWLVKTDANGVEQWNQPFGDTETDDDAYALVQTADGGFALAGDTQSFGDLDMWLVKTNANGVAQWNQTFGGTDFETAHALNQTADGGFALAGETSSYGAGGYDMWLVKTSANGVAQWNQTFGGTDFETAHALVQTADGGFALTGETNSYGAGGYDIWLVKTNANGVAQWNQTYGGAEWDGAFALVQTTDGGFVLAGFTESFGAGSRDMWLVKTDANGVAQWNQTYGGTETETARAL